MDVDLELQGAIVDRLKADPGVAALIGNRVFDTVPTDASFPYVSYGPVNALSVDADCIIGFDLAVQLNAWSRTVGFPEVKRIADAVRGALHDTDAMMQLVTVNALVLLEHRETTAVRDPDGLTNHAIISFVASIEQR